jgi:hypothetical protein
MRRTFGLPRPRPPNSGLRGAFSTASRASSAASSVAALARPKNPPRRLAGCRQPHSPIISLYMCMRVDRTCHARSSVTAGPRAAAAPPRP